MARYTARLLDAKDQEMWESLWSRSSGHLGLSWKYLEAAALGAGDPVRVGLFDQKGNLAAAVPFVSRKRRLVTQWHHPAPVPFAGLLHDRDTLQESSLRDLLNALGAFIEKSVPIAEIIFPTEIPDVRALIWRGWQARPHYNYVNHIASETSLVDAAENAARRQGRKAADSHTLQFGNERLEDLLDLWDETRARQRIPVYISKDCYRAVSKWTTPDLPHAVTALAVNENDTATAGGIFVHDGSRLYYLLGASIREDGPGSGAPSMLHFKITEKVFRDTGPFLYDWVGANTPGIAQFKKKFRPSLEICMRVTWRKGLVKEWM